MRRWRVTYEMRSGLDVWAIMRGLPALASAPVVEERYYRWRWLARLAAWSFNMGAATTPLVFGLAFARVEEA